jgi:mannose-6-phosphate isomerase
MKQSTLYPLRFDPIFQYRLWGGRGLEEFMSMPLPGEGPYGEAWIMSDRDDFSSVVTEGPLKGQTLTQLMRSFPEEMMGSLAEQYKRFPLLLKFLDCREMLSVQVHPSDSQTGLLPAGEKGKTEAWVVLDADPSSLIYEGLKPGTTPNSLRRAIEEKTVQTVLPSFTPKAGEAILIPAGTVHTLGHGVMVFEVQENSDVTFRLYDWDRIDSKTGKPRDLSVEKAIASIDFSQGVGRPVDPVVEDQNPVHRESLFQCDHFWVWRTFGEVPPTVGGLNDPHILVCLEGSGRVQYGDSTYGIRKGEVMLLPASIGECVCLPGDSMTLLEIKIPGVS